jgi:hypothetical protein
MRGAGGLYRASVEALVADRRAKGANLFKWIENLEGSAGVDRGGMSCHTYIPTNFARCERCERRAAGVLGPGDAVTAL